MSGSSDREIEESGEYDLEGLFVRLGYAIDKVGAKRVVLDTLEALFSGLGDGPVLRAELRRLFEWLKEGRHRGDHRRARGEGQLTRHGIEEYVSDCVIALDNRVEDQITTRRLRVVKYRGSAHGTNEYPFLIDESGISVLPITSAGLQHAISERRGADRHRRNRRDARHRRLLRAAPACWCRARRAPARRSSARSFVDAACARGERAIYFSFEESPGPDRPQHALGRDRPRRACRRRPALLRGGAAEPVRTGDASDADESRRSSEFESVRRGRRSDLGVPRAGVEMHAHAAAHGRPAQGQGHHRALHQPVRTEGGRTRPTTVCPR